MDVPRDSIRLLKNEHIWVPRSSRRAAASGLALYSPCAPVVVMGQRALYAAVRVLGPAVLPGRRGAWEDPVDHATWEDLLAQWADAYGSWNGVALYRRPQEGRSGFSVLLLRDGRGVGFVRVTSAAERARSEYLVLRGVHAAHPHTFRVTRPIGWGSAGEWFWVGSESAPNYPLGAVSRGSVREEVAEEISAILDDVLVRNGSIPNHWRGSHGDLSPWNLRTEWRGAVRVIDWEDARFAPPGVDHLYGALTAHQTFGTPLPHSTNAEAADWVAGILKARMGGDKRADAAIQELSMKLARVPLS